MRRFFAVLLALAALPAVPAAARQPGGDTAGYHFLAARRLEQSGKTEAAIAELRRAMELAPTSAEVRAELAALYARQDQIVDALNMAEEALKHDPNNVEANRILGSIFGALADQKRAVRVADDPSTYGPRAIAALEKARVPPGSDLNTELTLGRLYLRASNFEPAIAALLHVFEQQPQFVEGGLLLATAQQNAGRLADATTTLETMIAESPANMRVLARLIDLYERQRRWKDATSTYAAARELQDSPDLLRGHALALMNAGDAQNALAMLQAAAKTKTAPDPGVLYLIAESQRRLKDFSGALATSEKLRAAYPDRTVFVYQQAQLLEEGGRVADAERILRDLIAKHPRDANALNALGYMLADRGEKLDEAVDLLQRATKQEPGNASFLDSLGWALYRQGKVEAADAPLTEAAAKSPENSVIQDHLGDLRMRQQRVADAVQAWERALAGDRDSIDVPAVERKLRDARAKIGKR